MAVNQFLRSRARFNLDHKFRCMSTDRDDWLNRDERLRRKDLRKRIAEHVAKAVKQYGKDEMRLICELSNINSSVSSTGEWFKSYLIRKYGETFVENVTTWKNSWERVVWADEPWYQNSDIRKIHLTHVSEDDPTQIAYNRSIDNIKRDIQTRTKPGKYLTQFFSHVLSPSEIKYWAERQIAASSCQAELKFIENDNPDGWEHVYENGPHSCMAGKSAVQVYAYPGNGLRLAYLESGSSIVARAIVRNSDNQDQHGWLRIYSTEQKWDTKLRVFLEAAGYTKQINLHGVKLQRINEDHDGYDGVVCPYIDAGAGGHQMVSIHDDYIMVDNKGDIGATNTCGTIPLEEGRECDCCGEHTHEDELTYVESDDRSVCEHCLNERYTYAYGRRYQDYYRNDECIYCESDGEWYHQEYTSDHDIYQCEYSGDWYHMDDLVLCEAGEYEDRYIHTDEAVQESKTEKWMYQGDCTQINGEWVSDEFVADCHITGDEFDIRNGVTIETHTCRSHWGVPHAQRVHVSLDAWTRELIVDNFVKCGDLLLPNTYYGECITSGFEPANVEYGEDFDGEHLEDMFEDELAEAA